MATKNTNKTAKDASKRERDFDVDKFFADMEAENKRNLPTGAINGMPDKQPRPDMHFDINLWAWIPNNPPISDNNDGASIGKDKPSINRMLESEEQINGISVRIVESVNMGNDETLPQASIDEKAVQSEHQCTIAPGKSIQPKVSKAAKASVHQPSALENPTAKEANEIPDPAPQREVSIAEPIYQPDFSEHPTVEQSKKSRISAKKVDADFDELCRGFIHPASLGEKKPVFLPLALRDRLDDIARLSGDRRVSASHIAINIISRWIDDNRDTLNRKISNKDFSI